MAVNLSKPPWDKIMHTLIGLLIIAVVMAALMMLFGMPGGSALMIGIGVANGMLYGREVSGHQHLHGEDVVKGWFFWYWKRDAQLDWLIPAVLFTPLLLGYRYLYGPLW